MDRGILLLFLSPTSAVDKFGLRRRVPRVYSAILAENNLWRMPIRREGGYEHPFTQVVDIGSPATVLDGYGIDVQTLIATYTSAHNEPIPTIDQLFEELERDGVVGKYSIWFLHV